MSQGILSLDLGRKSAFAYGEPGRTPVWGHVTLAEPQAPGGCILAEARKWIESLIDYHNPSWIASEAPYVPKSDRKVPFNAATNARLQRLAGVPESIAFERGLGYREPDIRDVARHFLGKQGAIMRREAKKRQTREHCRLIGWWPCSEDEADSLALYSFMEFSLSPATARLRGERLPLWTVQSV